MLNAASYIRKLIYTHLYACGLWSVGSVVSGLWAVICGPWFAVSGMCGPWSVVCGLWYASCGLSRSCVVSVYQGCARLRFSG